MFVLEFYFIFYRVPKMMTRLARQRKRSAWKWSLLGMGAWVGAEFLIIFAFGAIYALGVEFADWPSPIPAGIKTVVYVAALVAALLSTTIVSRILTRIPREQEFLSPPLPPEFHRTESKSAD
jgi:hypothetical protein